LSVSLIVADRRGLRAREPGTEKQAADSGQFRLNRAPWVAAWGPGGVEDSLPRGLASVPPGLPPPDNPWTYFFEQSKLRQTLRQPPGGMDGEGRGVRIGHAAAALTVGVLVAGAAGGQVVTDVLTIGTVTVSSGTGQVEVPIYIQDNTGTPI